MFGLVAAIALTISAICALTSSLWAWQIYKDKRDRTRGQRQTPTEAGNVSTHGSDENGTSIQNEPSTRFAKTNENVPNEHWADAVKYAEWARRVGAVSHGSYAKTMVAVVPHPSGKTPFAWEEVSQPDRSLAHENVERLLKKANREQQTA